MILIVALAIWILVGAAILRTWHKLDQRDQLVRPDVVATDRERITKSFVWPAIVALYLLVVLAMFARAIRR